MLLGLVRPDAGEVLLLGRPVVAIPRSRSAVGYLPELFRYQPWLTAAEVLDLHVRLARRRRRRRRAAGVPGAGRARRPHRRPGRRVLQGHAAAPRPRGRPGRPAGARRPRRADQRARPARPGRRARPGALAQGARRRRPAQLAPHRRGRAGLRPGGDPRQGPGRGVGHPRRAARAARGAAAAGPASTAGAEDAAARGRRAGAQRRLVHRRSSPSDDDGVTVPDLVRDLVGLGVRVHAVEPVRISLEERLLAVLRHEEPEPRRHR